MNAIKVNYPLQFLLENRNSLLKEFRTKSGSHEDGEDLFNDTAEALLRYAQDVEIEFAPAYAYKTMNRVIRKFKAAEYERNKVSIPEMDDLRAWEKLLEKGSEAVVDPIIPILMEETRERLHQEARKVPNNTHRALLDHLIDGVSVRTACQMVGINRTNARVIYHRFLKVLEEQYS